MGAVPPSLFNGQDLEEGSIVGFENDDEPEQQQQQQQQDEQQAPLAPPPPPLPLPPQEQAQQAAPTATRENCFSVFANGEQTAFVLSFGMQFSKKVQEYGPLSMSGCLTLWQREKSRRTSRKT